jgi:hypothetical protein
MSRNSIEIRYEAGRLELISLRQRQGLLVNGDLIVQHQTLRFYDVITCPNADIKITLRKPLEPLVPPPGASPTE